MRRVILVCILGCLLVLGGGKDDAVQQYDVLGLSPRPAGQSSPRDRWFRDYNAKTGVWSQDTMNTAPYASPEQVRRACEEYLEAKSPGLSKKSVRVFAAHHARLWVLSYAPRPNPPLVTVGGVFDLWYDTMAGKVVAETYGQ